MKERKNRLVNLSTKITPRDYLAIRNLAAREGISESAWMRKFVENDITIQTERVNEIERDMLQEMVNNHNKKKSAHKVHESLFSKIKRMFT